MSQTTNELENSVTDLRVELAQAKERLAPEIVDHRQIKEQYRGQCTFLDERVRSATCFLTALYEIVLVANNAKSLDNLLGCSLEIHYHPGKVRAGANFLP